MSDYINILHQICTPAPCLTYCDNLEVLLTWDFGLWKVASAYS